MLPFKVVSSNIWIDLNLKLKIYNWKITKILKVYIYFVWM